MFIKKIHNSSKDSPVITVANIINKILNIVIFTKNINPLLSAK